MNKKKTWTDEENAFIRANFNFTHESIRDIARMLNERGGEPVTEWQVRYQVQQLGLPRKFAELGRKYWTPKEDEKLAELLDKHSIEETASRMRRGYNSVRVRATRLGLSAKSHSGWYTENEAAQVLGVDPHKVRGWIESGKLKASYHHGEIPTAGGARAWHIEEEDLREFIQKHSRELSGRHVDLGTIISMFSERNPLQNENKRIGLNIISYLERSVSPLDSLVIVQYGLDYYKIIQDKGNESYVINEMRLKHLQPYFEEVIKYMAANNVTTGDSLKILGVLRAALLKSFD